MSYDDSNKEHLVTSNYKAYSLDKFAKDFCGKSKISTLKSCDTLFIEDNNIVLIEFKNQGLPNDAFKEFYEKTLISIFVLKESGAMDLPFDNYNIKLIIVYNELKTETLENKFNDKVTINTIIRDRLKRKTGPLKRFGFERYIGKTINQIETLTPEEFLSDIEKYTIET